MILAGIDYSLNSPTICIKVNSQYYYYNEIKSSKNLTKKELYAIDLLNTLPLITIQKNIYTDADIYTNREYDNLVDATNRAENFLNFINKHSKNDATFIGIEGFSYGSKGNRLVELVGAQYILRYMLMKAKFPFYIVSPKTIKKVAGKGNYSKDEMISAFLNDERIKDTELVKLIQNNYNNFYINNRTWVKPIDDIIDSYWVMRCLENFLEIEKKVKTNRKQQNKKLTV